MRPIQRHVIVIVVSTILIAVLTWLTRIAEMPMRPIAPTDPDAGRSIVLRTDFSDDAAWRAVVAAIEAPAGDLRYILRFVSDPAHQAMTSDQVLAFAERAKQTFVFVVDRTTMTAADHPVLVVDAFERSGRSFRVTPAELWSVENNLALANMDFEEFATAVGADGVFRGFRRR
jgi:hypothetical protein